MLVPLQLNLVPHGVGQVMIELPADMGLKDSLVVAVPKIEGSWYTMHNVHIESLFVSVFYGGRMESYFKV
jgi:hypothetical protein